VLSLQTYPTRPPYAGLHLLPLPPPCHPQPALRRHPLTTYSNAAAHLLPVRYPFFLFRLPVCRVLYYTLNRQVYFVSPFHCVIAAVRLAACRCLH